MNITLKNAVTIVTDAVDVINKRFPIKWEDIANKPTIDVTDFYTKEEIKKILNTNNQLVSQDGTVWKPTIDNNGIVSWKKVMQNGQ
ncbi:prophage P2a protein 51 [Lactiplantibacillus plantarum]|nr:prophage P2a protein 51 [Lactiplantibacillus plantarum]MCG0812708.1 prophage P2a protein 51 [Lactiplantibacillus plantarum]MCG0878208.1 prophage P2a protein 51 [Lactiplantibacillus plantarum]MCG0951256.1 prophage P2a protein 51 [Lactiplantibacillus plantarum]